MFLGAQREVDVRKFVAGAVLPSYAGVAHVQRYNCPAGRGVAGVVDPSGVLSAADDADAAGNPIETIDITGTLRIAGTNTHAGLTAGLEQLANAKDTTLTATLSNNQEATVPRIPAAIVMTDGGSNTVANGPWYDPDYPTAVQRSDHKNEWSTVVVTQYLLTATYLKSAVEKNYSAYMALNDGKQDFPVYTVGVDLRDDTDDWVPARLYPMLDPKKYFKPEDQVPEEAGNPSTASGTVPLKSDDNSDYLSTRNNEAIIGTAYNKWTEWTRDANNEPTYNFPITHWSKSHDSRGYGQFQQNEGGSYNDYIIPFEQDAVNHVGRELFKGFNQLWHGWAGSTTSGGGRIPGRVSRRPRGGV